MSLQKLSDEAAGDLEKPRSRPFTAHSVAAGRRGSRNQSEPYSALGPAGADSAGAETGCLACPPARGASIARRMLPSHRRPRPGSINSRPCPGSSNAARIDDRPGLVHQFFQRLKLPVHAGEPHVRHLIDPPQPVGHQLGR